MTAAEHNTYPNGRWSSVPQILPPPASAPAPAPVVLEAHEMMELQLCEQRIERGLETFLEVGHALQLIRDKRLYRASHGTFEAYCQERWDIKASRARQLCAAVEIIQGLKTSGVSQLPSSERQTRPLLSVPVAQRPQVWQEAVSTAPQGKISAAHVEQTANRVLGRSKPAKPPVEASSRAEQLHAAANKAIASVRELLDLSGAADSEAAANVSVSLSNLEAYERHLQRTEPRRKTS